MLLNCISGCFKDLENNQNPLAQVACLKTLLYIQTAYISWQKIGYNCSPKLLQAFYLSSLLVLYVPSDIAQEMARILLSTTSHLLHFRVFHLCFSDSLISISLYQFIYIYQQILLPTSNSKLHQGPQASCRDFSFHTMGLLRKNMLIKCCNCCDDQCEKQIPKLSEVHVFQWQKAVASVKAAGVPHSFTQFCYSSVIKMFFFSLSYFIAAIFDPNLLYGNIIQSSLQLCNISEPFLGAHLNWK